MLKVNHRLGPQKFDSPLLLEKTPKNSHDNKTGFALRDPHHDYRRQGRTKRFATSRLLTGSLS